MVALRVTPLGSGQSDCPTASELNRLGFCNKHCHSAQTHGQAHGTQRVCECRERASLAFLRLDYMASGLGRTRSSFNLTNQFPSPLWACDPYPILLFPQAIPLLYDHHLGLYWACTQQRNLPFIALSLPQ